MWKERSHKSFFRMLCIENNFVREYILWTHTTNFDFFVFLFLFYVKVHSAKPVEPSWNPKLKRTADSSWCQQTKFSGRFCFEKVSDTVRLNRVLKRQIIAILYWIVRSANDSNSSVREWSKKEDNNKNNTIANMPASVGVDTGSPGTRPNPH